jgi:hypothetical protein
MLTEKKYSRLIIICITGIALLLVSLLAGIISTPQVYAGSPSSARHAASDSGGGSGSGGGTGTTSGSTGTPIALEELPGSASDESGTSLATDKSDYQVYDVPAISGAGFLPNSEVNISVTDPQGAVTTLNVTTDETGTFTANYEGGLMKGDYNVTASDGTNTITTVFSDAPGAHVIISDGSGDTLVNPGYGVDAANQTSAVLTWNHPNWSSVTSQFSDSGAQWIWNTYYVDDDDPSHAVNGEILTFQRTFDIPGSPYLGLLYITADNGYELYINNTEVGSAQVHDVGSTEWQDSNLTENYVNTSGWSTVKSYDVASYLQAGQNDLVVYVANEYMGPLDGQSDGTNTSNPGGLIYELWYEYAGIDVTKSVTPDNVLPGEQVTYTIEVNNTGDCPLEVNVNDSILGWLDTTTLDPGATKTYYPTYNPLVDTTNTVTVTGTNDQHNVEVQDSDSADVTVNPIPANGGPDTLNNEQCPDILVIDWFGEVTGHPVQSDCTLCSDINLTSPDGTMVIQIPEGTQLLKADGTPAQVGANPDVIGSVAGTPVAPAGTTIVKAYQMMPNGIVFKNHTATIAANYSKDNAPENASLTWAFYDDSSGQWVDLETAGFVAGGETVPDTVATNISHFTYFAILAK